MGPYTLLRNKGKDVLMVENTMQFLIKKFYIDEIWIYLKMVFDFIKEFSQSYGAFIFLQEQLMKLNEIFEVFLQLLKRTPFSPDLGPS